MTKRGEDGASASPRLRLSKLREIGWRHWDPIGLLASGARWEGEPFADEYDGYLVEAAGRLKRGATDAEIAAYLADVAADRMGLGRSQFLDDRAHRTVAAMRSEPDLWS